METLLWIAGIIALGLVIAYVSYRVVTRDDLKPKSGGGKGEGDEGP